jgi:hypothetical protein
MLRLPTPTATPSCWISTIRNDLLRGRRRHDTTARMITFARKYPLALLLAFAVVLRLAVLVALYPSLFAFEKTGAIHGSSTYDTYANNLLTTGVYGQYGDGVPDAQIPPLFGYVLALVYSVLGRSGFAVAVVNIALDVVTILALYHLAKRLFPPGKVVGLLAAGFYALYPYLIFQNLTLIDTPLFMALFYAWLLAMALLRERDRLDRKAVLLAIGAGVLLGLCALARTNVVLFAPLVAVWFLFRLRLLPAITRLVVVALVSALAVAPWLAYAYSLYGEFVPIALNGGENFYQGNNAQTLPYFRAGYDVHWVAMPENVAGMQLATPERSAALAAAGWQYLRDHPQVIPELLWTKFLIHWSIDIAPLRNPVAGEVPRLDYQGDAIVMQDGEGNLEVGGLPQDDPVNLYSSSLFDVVGRLVHRFYYGGLFILALVGCVLAFPHWRNVSLIWLVQFGATFSYVLFHPATRYRVPTDPLLFTLSAYALVMLWAWLRARRTQSTAVRVGV